MRQLALRIAEPPAPGFDNFVTGRNAELLAALHAQCLPQPAERMIYCWGEPGSGRTHLLQAAARHAPAMGRRSTWFSEEAADASALVLVDDVQRLDAEAQARLFGLYNELREGGGCLLAAGDAAPAHLPLRPDLLTRLAWGLVYQVHALSDQEKVAALERHAQARALRLPAEVSAYLLRHARRDMRSLVATLDALDRHSLETKRPITLPLLRDLLQDAAPVTDSLQESPS
jgi:DnaA-homolog protein